MKAWWHAEQQPADITLTHRHNVVVEAAKKGKHVETLSSLTSEIQV